MTLKRKPRPAAFDLGPKVKQDRFKAALAAAPKRRVGRHLVHFPEGEKPFILAKRVDGRLKRRIIELRECVKCGKEFIWQSGARSGQVHCSQACGGAVTQAKRRKQIAARGGPKRDALDRRFSAIVRSVGFCRACGSTERLQCAHIVSRRYLGVRFSFDNAMCLCASCHLKYTHRPLEWEVYITEQFGPDLLPSLKTRALAYKGPLDRIGIARTLNAEADRLGLKSTNAPAGWSGWTSLTLEDPESAA